MRAGSSCPTVIHGMQSTTGRLASDASRLARRIDLPAAGAWLLTFAPVLYLAVRSGGYDAVVRGEVATALWWLLAAGALVGLLPAVRPGRAALALLGTFALFTAWTALGIAWSQGAERGVIEVARLVSYLGMLGLAVLALDARTARSALHGAAVACAAVGLLAVMSRLIPSSFPDHELVGEGADPRLAYPLGYAGALGSFMAIGIPVVLAAAASARTILGKSMSAGAVPILVLALYLSGSRGGLLAAVIGVLAWIAMAPDRLLRLATLTFAAAGATVLLKVAADRGDLREGVLTPAAYQQADQMLAYLLFVCVGVALLEGAMSLVLRVVTRPAWSRPSRATGFAVLAVIVLGGAGVAITTGATGVLSEKSREFRAEEPEASVAGQDVFGRLQNLSDSNRYAYWQSALRAWETDRLKGIGPGGFELWWARDGEFSEFVRDAHSLYFETLAELGVVGLALLAVALALMLGGGAAGALRGGPEPRRIVAAGATAGVAAFAAGAAVDWNWEFAVLPMLALLLASAALASGRAEPADSSPRRWWSRAAIVVTAVAAIVLIAMPLDATRALRASQAALIRGDFTAALASADEARRLQPYAAGPRHQRAIVLERAGDVDGAARAVGEAIRRSPKDWRLWLLRSRLQAKQGRVEASRVAYRRARSLSPRFAISAR